MARFTLTCDYVPSGDQPEAIAALSQGVKDGKRHQILLGATGSGKTFTMANVIQTCQKPTLIIAHNKTLAAQLFQEFNAYFPDNAVEYFISYYDYYQPEAYIPSRDVYIEKEADINTEIEKLRHRATHSLLTRKDVIIVASVSCIYGLGMPENYLNGVIKLVTNVEYDRAEFLYHLDAIQYERNDTELTRGRYRIKGDNIDICPAWEDHLLRLEFFGDELERIRLLDPINLNEIESLNSFDLFPATHYLVNDTQDEAVKAIEAELKERLAELNEASKTVEAHRLKQRTQYDMEMLAETGYCKGIENYSRHLSGLPAGHPPGVLLDFFPDHFLTIIDESHVTIGQIRGMYAGDRSRKMTLVEHGFRLPSAMDNRPLNFDEFLKKNKQFVYVSATPGDYELEHCKRKTPNPEADPKWKDYDIVQQIIRPTGLVDPIVTIQPTRHQIDHLMTEIHAVIANQNRVMITTLTKKMAEDLTDYLQDKQIKVTYLHSEINTLDRSDILLDFRSGKYDVLVGVNLLREGLDLPEVELVAIMDADKEGFLRNERSLIQTIGRAARNENGRVILYADKLTDSMKSAIDETNRRRTIQLAYNKEHGIQPKTIIKEIRRLERPSQKEKSTQAQNKLSKHPLHDYDNIPQDRIIPLLERDMMKAAENLEFELAAAIRDQLNELKLQAQLDTES